MYDKQISEGVALLDADQPGWPGVIDLTALDIADPDACVLHQVYGSYRTACDHLGLNRAEIAACGFALPNDAWSKSQYELLTREWITAIQARTAAPEPAPANSRSAS